MAWHASVPEFRLPPLRRLSVEDRIRALTRLEDSQAGSSLVLACKAVLCMVYYEEEEAARAIAAHDPCDPDRRRLPLLIAQSAAGSPASAIIVWIASADSGHWGAGLSRTGLPTIKIGRAHV